MRIGVIGPHAPDDFADNICDSLEAMGIESVALGSAESRPRNRHFAAAAGIARRSVWLDEFLQQKIAANAAEHECDAVIAVEGNTSPLLVSQLRKHGMSVALWFPDHITNLGRLQMLLAPYSALFFKEPRLVERLRATLDLPVYYLAEACNDRWHRSDLQQGTDPVIVVAGNMYPSRLLLLERLLDEGIPLRAYGPGFPRWVTDSPVFEVHRGRYVARREKADIFRQAAAVLNNLHPGEVDGVNCRLFEATGSGAVVLAESRSELERFFDPDEVLSWSSFDDLVVQARFALANAGALQGMGDKAAKHSHTEHTYELRLAVILEHLI